MSILDVHRFLSLLTSAERPVATFVTMRNGEPGKPMYNMQLGDALPTLRALNKTGSDIFFTVNETDGFGRRFENITWARCVFADYDAGVPHENSWRLTPSILVESSPGKAQAYWILASREEPRERWHAAERGVVWATGADRNVCDAARVLRLPGFINWKYKERPLTSLLHTNQNTFSLGQIEAAYPPIAAPAQMAAGSAVPSVEEAVKIARYKKWLEAAGAPAQSSSGRLPVARNWLFRKCAAGVWDFALPAATVAQVISDHIDDLHYDDAADFARDAQRYGHGILGSAYVRHQVGSLEMQQ